AGAPPRPGAAPRPQRAPRRGARPRQPVPDARPQAAGDRRDHHPVPGGTAGRPLGGALGRCPSTEPADPPDPRRPDDDDALAAEEDLPEERLVVAQPHARPLAGQLLEDRRRPGVAAAAGEGAPLAPGGLRGRAAPGGGGGDPPSPPAPPGTHRGGVGRAVLLEAPPRPPVSGVAVGVMAERQPAVGVLDLLLGGGL